MSRKLLNKLRQLMKKTEPPIDAYIVTRSDPHNSEYLSEDYKRLEFISNFSGSYGTAIVTGDKALLWTDGRYFIQASNELDSNWILMKAFLVSTPTEGNWIRNNLPKGCSVGVDPSCISCSVWQALCEELNPEGINLVPLSTNLIDQIWGDSKPAKKENPIRPLPIRYSGLSAAEKVDSVRKSMKDKVADVYVVTALDDVAWLLNLRGSDVDFNPVFFSYVIVTNSRVNLFVGEDRITPEIKEHFKEENVDIIIHDYDSFYNFLFSILVNDLSIKKVWIPKTANYYLYSIIPSGKRHCELSAITYLKAIKNAVEIENMVKAHIQDGIALCRYYSWLEEEVPKGQVTELSGARQLKNFWEETEDYVGLSFATISSSGPNSAVNHYSPTTESDRPLNENEIYLCDSGAQFYTGTTDVTRTMHFGTPTTQEREFYTTVFKCQLALGSTVFPSKTEGKRLDSLARTALWKLGLDYNHGTGHGIGSYLNVHEGPMGISNKPCPDDPGIVENMFLSNEPGVYFEGEFGVRLENIERIVKAKTPFKFMDREYLVMETVTLCPYQIKMLLIPELTPEEIRHLNNYHKRCLDILGPLLKEKGYDSAYAWLKRATIPV